MSTIVSEYDPAIQQFNFTLSGGDESNLLIQAQLKLYGEVMPLDNFSYGFELSRWGAIVNSATWPPEGVEFVSTDQPIIEAHTVPVLPYETYQLLVWFINNGVRYEGTHTFVTPRLAQPYPSWTWVDNKWTPPVPPPEEPAHWDEDSQSWIPA